MPPSRLPSAKQLAIYWFIIDYVERHCFQPTVGEIAAHMKMNRPTALYHLRELKSIGLLDPVPGRADRGWRLPGLICRVFRSTEDDIPEQFKKRWESSSK